jgi:tRNA(fMet)-specific endonuclease VapC
LTRYLLDTNIIWHLADQPTGPLARRLRGLAQESVCTSIIVSAEVRFGLAKRGSQPLSDRVLLILSAIQILPWEVPADQIYGELRARVQRQGQPIGSNDLLIAAHALALDRTLVTANEREFRQIPGLSVENWLA